MTNWIAIFLWTSYTQSLSSYTFTSTCSKALTILNYNEENNPDGLEQQLKNEIKDYVNGQYLGSIEAAWHMLGFHITTKTPAVCALPVHLPGENIPQFLKEDSASLLIHYFHRPNLPQFDHLTYIQYNQQYVFYPYNEHTILANDEFLETPIHRLPM